MSWGGTFRDVCGLITEERKVFLFPLPSSIPSSSRQLQLGIILELTARERLHVPQLGTSSSSLLSWLFVFHNVLEGNPRDKIARESCI